MMHGITPNVPMQAQRFHQSTAGGEAAGSASQAVRSMLGRAELASGQQQAMRSPYRCCVSHSHSSEQWQPE